VKRLFPNDPLVDRTPYTPWEGLETFFKIDEEILISRRANDTLHYMQKLSEVECLALGRKAQARVLAELEKEVVELLQEHALFYYPVSWSSFILLRISNP
jgi:hypothetical protein